MTGEETCIKTNKQTKAMRPWMSTYWQSHGRLTKNCCNWFFLPQPYFTLPPSQSKPRMKNITCLKSLEYSKTWLILELHHCFKVTAFFVGSGEYAVLPRHKFLSWQTSLLCRVVELAEEGFAINGATLSSLEVCNL